MFFCLSLTVIALLATILCLFFLPGSSSSSCTLFFSPSPSFSLPLCTDNHTQIYCIQLENDTNIKIKQLINKALSLLLSLSLCCQPKGKHDNLTMSISIYDAGWLHTYTHTSGHSEPEEVKKFYLSAIKALQVKSP